MNKLPELVGVQLYPNNAMHVGGWHIHGTGYNLNPHWDFSIGPKPGLQRKVNIITCMSEELKA